MVVWDEKRTIGSTQDPPNQLLAGATAPSDFPIYSFSPAHVARGNGVQRGVRGSDVVLDGHHLSAARRSMELEERGKGDEGGVRFREKDASGGQG